MKISSLLFVFALLAMLSGCAPGQYSSPYGSSTGYGGSSYYGDRYDDRYRYEREQEYRRELERRKWEEQERYEHERRQLERERYEHNRDLERAQREVRPTPTPEPRVIRPSCPSNTTFDGKHCIVPENQRRKGGKGTISACPDGMWVSGDRCVGN